LCSEETSPPASADPTALVSYHCQKQREVRLRVPTCVLYDNCAWPCGLAAQGSGAGSGAGHCREQPSRAALLRGPGARRRAGSARSAWSRPSCARRRRWARPRPTWTTWRPGSARAARWRRAAAPRSAPRPTRRRACWRSRRGAAWAPAEPAPLKGKAYPGRGCGQGPGVGGKRRG